MRYYEDIKINAMQVSDSYTVTASEIMAIGEQFDPLPMQIDEKFAEQTEFGGLIASGVHTIALWRKLDFKCTSDVSVVCGLGLDKIRFVRPLYANDTITCESKVMRKTPSATRDNCGILHFRHHVINQNAKIISSHTSQVLVRRRPSTST